MVENNIAIQIQNIKKRLRLAMNGVVSSSMRERGLDYKLNFGVALPALRRMGDELGKNHDLAQALWGENIRELKILATLIQPVESFTKELAYKWIAGVNNPEIAEQCAMNLFQHLDFASTLSVKSLTETSEMIRYAAWHLLARLAQKGNVPDAQSLDVILAQAEADLQSDALNLFNGALLALKRLGVKDKDFAEKMLKGINNLSLIDCVKKQQIYDDLKFEFDYYL